MKYNKESLQKLLKLIGEIADDYENEWFKIQLMTEFATKEKERDNILLLGKIDLIENYLSLDLSQLIDYSGFDEPSREQLFRDNVEMIRYRKGSPNHKVCFGEFCRYAHLQAEEMINYFLNKSFASQLDKIILFIKDRSKYKPEREASEIHHIHYSFKLQAVNKFLNLPKQMFNFLWFLNDFRNELSHRNSLSIEKENECLRLYEKHGFLKIKWIDFHNLTREQKTIVNDGRYVIQKRSNDFDGVNKVIGGLKSAILKSIHDQKKQSVSVGDAAIAQIQSFTDGG